MCLGTYSSFLLPKTDAAGTHETWRTLTRQHGVNTVACNRNVSVRIWVKTQNLVTNIFWGLGLAQAVIRQAVVAEAWLQSQVSPCKICGGQSGTVTGSSAST
jgi:hypothetical protein